VGTVTSDLDADLRRLFGFPGFRPGQRDAVEAALAGRDVLAIMPTGSGKSLCYQLPALVGDGVTLVVSPLIALMEDQHAALRARGLEGVEMLSSSMAREDVDGALRRIGSGEARLVYVAPERFSSRRFLDAIGACGISRLAVDEAHCLSEWGHDFRPDYLRLADVRERLGDPPTMALTATATPRVARDVAAALRLRDPVMPRTGFDRPNLLFGVRPVSTDADKAAVLLGLLRTAEGLPAVIYCGRRRTCEEVAAMLQDAGIRAAPYHAGLHAELRTETLEGFLAGELEAVAATTAFGMGIDKPDVRSVVHWMLPSSPEEYYQQAGRAGRDGLPARCTLLYSPRDKGLIAYFIGKARLSADELTAVHGSLAERAGPDGLFHVFERDVQVQDVRAALAVLERAGALQLFPAPSGTVSGRLAGRRLAREHVNGALVAVRRVERMRWERLKAIDRYATTRGCRRAELLGYFGETPAARPPERCCDGHGRADEAAAGPSAASNQVSNRLAIGDAILLAVDETQGRAGRTRLAQILCGSRASALVAARHDRLSAHGALAAMSQRGVLEAVDRLIAQGTLEQTGGPYPLVRRAGGHAAVTARDADVRAQVIALGRARDAAAVPFLLRVLAEGASEEARRLAAGSLGMIGEARAEAGLVVALTDASAGVRREAATALGRVGRSGCLDALSAAGADPDPAVVAAAEAASARIRHRP
jgi:ATP-dependent DNA helicase RecQ